MKSTNIFAIGEVLSGLGFDPIPLSCHYQVNLQDPWFSTSQLSGQSSFNTPQDTQVQGHCFLLQFDFQLNSTSILNWPQIIFDIYAQRNGTQQLYAKGQALIPSCTGIYELSVKCYSQNNDYSYNYLKGQASRSQQCEAIQDVAGTLSVKLQVYCERLNEIMKELTAKDEEVDSKKQ